MLKKIGVIFFLLAVSFILKFSFGNLNGLSFFLKIGCNSESKEYSFSVESGCKKEEEYSSPKPISRIPEVSVIAQPNLVKTPEIVQRNSVPVVASSENFEKSKPEIFHPNFLERESFDIEIEPFFADFEAIEDIQNEILAVEPQIEIENHSEAAAAAEKDEDCEIPSSFLERKSTGIQSGPRVEEYCCSDMPWDPIPWPKRFTIRHVWGTQENQCIPFASNYTTAELLFAPDYRLGHVMPFVDIRGHRFDNNTYAANVGIGGRYIPNPSSDCFCEVLGFNGYYDYRQGCIGYFQQVGLGLEILSSRWDLRANAYVPFGKKKQVNRLIFDDYIGDYVVIRDDIESISYAFNAEVGFLFVRTLCERFLLYGAAGPYFIARGICDDGVVGGEVRIRPQYKDYVALDLSYRYDKLFETVWQVEIILNLPLYQISGKNRYPCSLSDRQIYQPIERFEVMPLNRRLNWYTNY